MISEINYSNSNIITEISNLDPSSFESMDEFRRVLLAITKVAKSKLASTAETAFNADVASKYISELLDLASVGRKLSKIPPEIADKTRSNLCRNIIKDSVDAHPIFSKQCSNNLTETARRFVISSKNIIELRKALVLYSQAADIIVDDDLLEEYSGLNSHLEDKVDYYRQSYEELVQVLTVDDKKTFTALQVHKLSKEGVSIRAIAKELGITDRNVRTFLRNYEFQL